jgi:hypothetical protein
LQSRASHLQLFSAILFVYLVALFEVSNLYPEYRFFLHRDLAWATFAIAALSVGLAVSFSVSSVSASS